MPEAGRVGVAGCHPDRDLSAVALAKAEAEGSRLGHCCLSFAFPQSAPFSACSAVSALKRAACYRSPGQAGGIPRGRDRLQDGVAGNACRRKCLSPIRLATLRSGQGPEIGKTKSVWGPPNSSLESSQLSSMSPELPVRSPKDEAERARLWVSPNPLNPAEYSSGMNGFYKMKTGRIRVPLKTSEVALKPRHHNRRNLILLLYM